MTSVNFTANNVINNIMIDYANFIKVDENQFHPQIPR